MQRELGLGFGNYQKPLGIHVGLTCTSQGAVTKPLLCPYVSLFRMVWGLAVTTRYTLAMPTVWWLWQWCCHNSHCWRRLFCFLPMLWCMSRRGTLSSGGSFLVGSLLSLFCVGDARLYSNSTLTSSWGKYRSHCLWMYIFMFVYITLIDGILRTFPVWRRVGQYYEWHGNLAIITSCFHIHVYIYASQS